MAGFRRFGIPVQANCAIGWRVIGGGERDGKATLKLGRADEAHAAGERVLSLQPNFRISEFSAAINPAPAIAEPLTEALRAVDLPE